MSSLRRTFVKKVGIIIDRIVGSSDQEVLVDQVSDLSSSEKAIFFLSFLFLQTDHLLEEGILDDLVQSRNNLRVEYCKIREMRQANVADVENLSK